MRSSVTNHDRRIHLLAIAVLWLFGGGVLLLTTLVPAHTALLGWAPLLWLLGAPLAWLGVWVAYFTCRALGEERMSARTIAGLGISLTEVPFT